MTALRERRASVARFRDNRLRTFVHAHRFQCIGVWAVIFSALTAVAH